MTMQDLKLFDQRQIRTVWDEEQEKWYFCINDVIVALTDCKDPVDYFKKVRKRDPELDIFVRGTICPPHQFISTDTNTLKDSFMPINLKVLKYALRRN